MTKTQLDKAWDISEINWSAFDADKLPKNLMQIIATTALVESRADMYAEYLLSVFDAKPEWHAKIRRWNREEKQHGQSLRKWYEKAEVSFDFENTYQRYIARVQYHEKNGSSARGSIKNELVTRCTVEALASGYYAALYDANDEPLLQEICSRLRQDEARHFSLFSSLLNESGGVTGFYRFSALSIVIRRMLELGDEQIMYAAYCVGKYERWEDSAKKVAADYFLPLLSAYTDKHARYICKMLLKIFALEQNALLLAVATKILLLAIRIKQAYYAQNLNQTLLY